MKLSRILISFAVFRLSFRKEFCELCLAKERQTDKVFVCKKFLKKDGRKVRKAAKNEIMILKMYVMVTDVCACVYVCVCVCL